MAECKKCGSCCQNLPGFFEPDRDDLLLQVADYLGIAKEELKEKYLIKDYRAPFGKKVWFWTPRMVSKDGKPLLLDENCSLEEYPQKAEQLGKAGGHCIFYHNQKCSIHPVKPITCQIYNCQEKDQTAALYFQYFGGNSNSAEEKIKINQAEWALLWDFYCPQCGQDEAEYTGEKLLEELELHEVLCQNCAYRFWVY